MYEIIPMKPNRKGNPTQYGVIHYRTTLGAVPVLQTKNLGAAYAAAWEHYVLAWIDPSLPLPKVREAFETGKYLSPGRNGFEVHVARCEENANAKGE